jgi:hypothetical protein
MGFAGFAGTQKSMRLIGLGVRFASVDVADSQLSLL